MNREYRIVPVARPVRGAGTGSGDGPAFVRAVSRWQIVALSLNDVIGSGVYLLPAAAAALLGPSSLWAVGIAGIAVFLIVLCFAEASSYFEEPGSAYLYTRSAFGELVGFQVGWMAWLTRVAAAASLSVGFAQALTYTWPAAGGGWGRGLAIGLPLAALTAINVIGIRSGVRTAVAFVIVKLVPLVIFVGAGFAAVSWATAAAQSRTQPGGLGGAALLLLFAYAGFENTPAAAGEYRDPRRDVPFALVTQIALVTLLYGAVQFVALGTLPGLGGSETPLADAARLFLGSWAGTLLTLGAAVSILGTVSNSVLAGPRYLYALAADGYGPRFLAQIHPRFRTPAAAILLQTLIALPLALTGSFVGLAALSVVTRLVTYLGTALAVPVLRHRFAASPNAFRLPFGPLIPAAAVVLSLALAASAEPENLYAAGIAVVVGLGVWKTRRR
jgi:basic amino acid/polyamine antiporter, APA family